MVNWGELEKLCQMTELKKSLHKYKNLEVQDASSDEDHDHGRVGRLQMIDAKINAQAKDIDPENKFAGMLGDNQAVSETLKANRKTSGEANAKKLDNYDANAAESASDISDAISPAKVERQSEAKSADKRVELNDLITELRHKYITILKSIQN